MDEFSTVNLPPKMTAVKKRRITDLTEEETNWSIQYLFKKVSDSFTSNGRYTFKYVDVQKYLRNNSTHSPIDDITGYHKAVATWVAKSKSLKLIKSKLEPPAVSGTD